MGYCINETIGVQQTQYSSPLSDQQCGTYSLCLLYHNIVLHRNTTCTSLNSQRLRASSQPSTKKLWMALSRALQSITWAHSCWPNCSYPSLLQVHPQGRRQDGQSLDAPTELALFACCSSSWWFTGFHLLSGSSMWHHGHTNLADLMSMIRSSEKCVMIENGNCWCDNSLIDWLIDYR